MAAPSPATAAAYGLAFEAAGLQPPQGEQLNKQVKDSRRSLRENALTAPVEGLRSVLYAAVLGQASKLRRLPHDAQNTFFVSLSHALLSNTTYKRYYSIGVINSAAAQAILLVGTERSSSGGAHPLTRLLARMGVDLLSVFTLLFVVALGWYTYHFWSGTTTGRERLKTGLKLLVTTTILLMWLWWCAPLLRSLCGRRLQLIGESEVVEEEEEEEEHQQELPVAEGSAEAQAAVPPVLPIAEVPEAFSNALVPAGAPPLPSAAGQSQGSVHWAPEAPSSVVPGAADSFLAFTQGRDSQQGPMSTTGLRMGLGAQAAPSIPPGLPAHPQVPQVSAPSVGSPPVLPGAAIGGDGSQQVRSPQGLEQALGIVRAAHQHSLQGDPWWASRLWMEINAVDRAGGFDEDVRLLLKRNGYSSEAVLSSQQPDLSSFAADLDRLRQVSAFSRNPFTQGVSDDARATSQLPADLKRAAPEIYRSLRSTATSVRDWLNQNYDGSKRSPQWQDLWNAALVADYKIDAAAMRGEQAKEEILRQDDTIEISLRRLAAYIFAHRTGDYEAANHMLAQRAPGSAADIAPAWMITDASTHSKAEFQRTERVKNLKKYAGGDGKGKGGKGGKKGGKGGGAQGGGQGPPGQPQG